MFSDLNRFIREQYETNDFIPLHAPIFLDREREYLLDAIDSTYVSSVGRYVDQFEVDIARYTGSPCAVATVNGTSALHTALLLSGVTKNDYVITQSLTFVATCNAIRYCLADPIFLDVDKETLGLSASAVKAWLESCAYVDDQSVCRYKQDHRVIRACLPMHTFGHPVDLDALLKVCKEWRLAMVEDAAESLGSFYKGRHTGTFGDLGILSFNGNKIITTGGGGMILSNEVIGKRAKHLTTTSKVSHAYEFFHDELGFNYRMPNLNAALGCAQLAQMPVFLDSKRALAGQYTEFFKQTDIHFVIEPPYCQSNYWLNAVICQDRSERDKLLKVTNDNGVMTRPVWTPMHQLPMFKDTICDSLTHTTWLAERLVNLPSSVISRVSHA